VKVRSDAKIMAKILLAALGVGKLSVLDKQWSRTVARIVRKTQATVLPVYFEGHNSPLFCGLGLLHSMIRTLMLPAENLKRRPRTVRAHVGKPVLFKRLAGLDDFEVEGICGTISQRSS